MIHYLLLTDHLKTLLLSADQKEMSVEIEVEGLQRNDDEVLAKNQLGTVLRLNLFLFQRIQQLKGDHPSDLKAAKNQAPENESKVLNNEILQSILSKLT